MNGRGRRVPLLMRTADIEALTTFIFTAAHSHPDRAAVWSSRRLLIAIEFFFSAISYISSKCSGLVVRVQTVAKLLDLGFSML